MPVESVDKKQNIVAGPERSLYDVQERSKTSRPNQAISSVRAVILTALVGVALWWLVWKLIVHFGPSLKALVR